MIYDMHCDTITKIWAEQKSGKESGLRENNFHIDLMKMKKAGYGLQCFAAYINKGEALQALKLMGKEAADEAEYPKLMAEELINTYWNEIKKNEDMIAPVLSAADIDKNEKEGRMSALLTIEGGEACLGNLSQLRKFYDMGVRLMTLTWNYENELGYPNTDIGHNENSDVTVPDISNGLKDKGIEFVEEMQKLGMAVDVSHLSDAGFMDVAKYSTKPFTASHSNARKLAGHVRNLTDEMIRIIAQKGGVIGLNYYGRFLNFEKNSDIIKSTVDDIVRHAEYMKNTGGIDVIGLGSDFDGIDGELQMKDCGYLEMLIDGLVRNGFTENEIDKITYKNVKRFLYDIL